MFDSPSSRARRRPVRGHTPRSSDVLPESTPPQAERTAHTYTTCSPTRPHWSMRNCWLGATSQAEIPTTSSAHLRSDVMRGQVALTAAACAAVIVIASGCAGNASSNQAEEQAPFVLGDDFQSGLSVGSWDGERGMFEPYGEGKLFQVLFNVRNRAPDPVTLLTGTQDQKGHSLLRLIGVIFSRVPNEGRSCPLVSCSVGPWGSTGAVEPEPEPVTVPPGQEAYVQLNFKMGECEFFPPGDRLRYNETLTIGYEREGETSTAVLDLSGLTVTVIAPKPENCPGSSRTDSE
jgi:hypothetical protein